MIRTVYKLDSKKNLQQLTLKLQMLRNCVNDEGWVSAEVTTTWGLVGGKMQTTREIVTHGKNIGRKNETTPLEQAQKLFVSKLGKKLKAGWVFDKRAAREGQVSDVVKGGIVPMLANVYEPEKHEKFLEKQKVFYSQPKLDGIRCIAIFKNGETTLWTRSRRQILSCPHICEEITALCKYHGLSEFVFDGELYNHELKDNFQKIVSLVRKSKPLSDADQRLIQYYIYDLPSLHGRFSARYAQLDDFNDELLQPVLNFVQTREHRSVDSYMLTVEEDLKNGYEGTMIRFNGLYENKRSNMLLKHKPILDDEFKIIGVNEGKGKLKGHAATFVCKTKEKPAVQFNATIKADMGTKKKIFKAQMDYVGKFVQVKFKGYTKDGSLREPVAIRLRDSKDF